MGKPKVLLISTGGTITMTPGTSGGVVPTLTGDDLVKAVPALAEHCDIEVVSYSTRPGASLKIDDLIKMATIITQAFDGETAGAIVVQGTDTIEETAFVFDLLVSSHKPVVVTGAMRGAAMVSADGPANLLSSVIVASSPDAQNKGSMVVLNDEIHAARRVQKRDTSSVAAFGSPGFGPLGRIVEQKAVFHGCIERTRPVPAPASIGSTAVALVKVGLDDDGRLLKSLPALGYTGAVIEAMGAGHLPSHFAELASELLASMPVVLATRVPAGPIFSRTYSFPGSEMDLLSRGTIPSGTLGSLRARLLLTLLMANGLIGKQLESEFLSRCN